MHMPVTMTTMLRHLARLTLINCFCCRATCNIISHQTFFDMLLHAQRVMVIHLCCFIGTNYNIKKKNPTIYEMILLLMFHIVAHVFFISVEGKFIQPTANSVLFEAIFHLHMLLLIHIIQI